jgi:hypothetical protein
MVSMKNQTIASLTEIEAVLVECSNCRSQVRVPVGAILVQRDLRMVPLMTCPVCLQNSDSTLIEYVRAFGPEQHSQSSCNGQTDLSGKRAALLFVNYYDVRFKVRSKGYGFGFAGIDLPSQHSVERRVLSRHNAYPLTQRRIDHGNGIRIRMSR